MIGALPPSKHLQRVRENSPFLAACAGQTSAHTPVWFMRQAGRALPEYREVRGDGSILEAIRKPQIAAELTRQPIRRLNVDAAILFSDIMTPLVPRPFAIDIVPGIGPVVSEPFRTDRDLKKLEGFDAEAEVPYVIETILELTETLDVPLIGFAGAPFTLASYLIDGRPSKTHEHTKLLAMTDPSLFVVLLDTLADLTISYLQAQIDAGVSAIQLFDSWAGVLAKQQYVSLVMPSVHKILDAFATSGVPTILFGTNTSELLVEFASTSANVIGIDSYLTISEARKRVGLNRPVQGNLDPITCLAEWPIVKQAVDDVLESNNKQPGFIFNLGHGVLPQTNPDILSQVVAHVHQATSN